MKEISHVLWSYAKRKPLFMLTNISFSLLIPVQDVILPHYYGKVLSALEKKKALVLPIIVVMVMLIVLQIGYIASDWHDTKLFPDIQAFIRRHMLKKTFETYETSLQDLQNGDVMSKFIKIPTHLTQTIERVKNYIFPYIVSYIFAVVYITMQDSVMGLGLGILVCVYLYLVIGAPYFCKAVSIEKDESQNVLADEVDDAIRNLISIYTSDQIDYELKRLDQFEKVYAEKFKETMQCALRTRRYVLPVLVLFLAWFLWRCKERLAVHKMVSAQFVAIFIMILYILSSMMVLTDQMRDMIFEIGILSSFEEVFSHKSKDHHNVKKNKQISRVANHRKPSGIYIDNVSYLYPESAKYALKDFSLHILANEKTCIIGDIGSGKSTILKLLLKLVVPNSGDIYLNKIPYSTISLQELRQRIGYVPQTAMLFNRTILENIKYGNPGVQENDIIQLIEELDLMKEFGHLENGLNTKIGKNGSKLSGGQRQLVWCLRVLLKNPDILILDEPTASLDDNTKNLMKKLLDFFMQDRTVLMVTHDPVLMTYADRVITLSQGTIVSDDRTTF
jgi:ABC-type multidrug transport system fused ATPase/permease subunit